MRGSREGGVGGGSGGWGVRGIRRVGCEGDQEGGV